MTHTEAQIEAAARARADLIRERYGLMPMRDDEFSSYLVERPEEVEEVRVALAAAEEAGEWEYEVRREHALLGNGFASLGEAVEYGNEYGGEFWIRRRRKAGEYETVEGGEG